MLGRPESPPRRHSPGRRRPRSLCSPPGEGSACALSFALSTRSHRPPSARGRPLWKGSVGLRRSLLSPRQAPAFAASRWGLSGGPEGPWRICGRGKQRRSAEAGRAAGPRRYRQGGAASPSRFSQHFRQRSRSPSLHPPTKPVSCRAALCQPRRCHRGQAGSGKSRVAPWRICGAGGEGRSVPRARRHFAPLPSGDGGAPVRGSECGAWAWIHPIKKRTRGRRGGPAAPRNRLCAQNAWIGPERVPLWREARPGAAPGEVSVPRHKGVL